MNQDLTVIYQLFFFFNFLWLKKLSKKYKNCNKKIKNWKDRLKSCKIIKDNNNYLKIMDHSSDLLDKKVLL